MERLLISSCLLGNNCKYSGGNNALPAETLEKLKARYALVPVCPETAGGLPIPREPSERSGDAVIGKSGRDVTAEYRKGADIALRLARRFGCKLALLKERSPSCGSGSIYDGTFTGTVIPGDGVTAERLRAAGVALWGESGIEKLLKEKGL